MNTEIADSQMHGSLTSLANGRFMQAWMSKKQDGDGYGTYAQRFEANATKAGVEFRVNAFTVGDQDYPQAASFDDGSFVAVWESYGQDGSAWGVFGRRFGQDGVPKGPDFQVNAHTVNDQRLPDVAVLADGGFVVSWTGEGPEDDTGCYARLYAADASSKGDSFLLNTHVSGWQWNPVVASFPDGTFIAVWRSAGQDGDVRGVFAQRFADDGSRKYK